MPNSTLPKSFASPKVRLTTGVRGWRVALAFWLNASITAQTAAESNASFFGGTMLSVFIVSFMLPPSEQDQCQVEILAYEIYNSLYTSDLRGFIIHSLCA